MFACIQKRRLEAYEKELAQKQAKTSTSSSSSETPSTSTFSKIKLQSQPKTSSSDPGQKTDVKELLENLVSIMLVLKKMSILTFKGKIVNHFSASWHKCVMY